MTEREPQESEGFLNSTEELVKGELELIGNSSPLKYFIMLRTPSFPFTAGSNSYTATQLVNIGEDKSVFEVTRYQIKKGDIGVHAMPIVNERGNTVITPITFIKNTGNKFYVFKRFNSPDSKGLVFDKTIDRGGSLIFNMESDEAMGIIYCVQKGFPVLAKQRPVFNPMIYPLPSAG